MNRHSIFILTLLWMAGCQSGQPGVKISPEQARALNLTLTGGIAAEPSGSVVLTTPSGPKRYHPDTHRLETLLNEACTDIRDVAVTSDGVLLALRPQSLSAIAAGYLVPFRTLPTEAAALSCDREFAYILTRTPQGGRLIRYALTGRNQGQIQTILTTEDQPRALCAVRGGCLLASGGSLVKVTDPVDGQVTTALLAAIQKPITSVVADQTRLIVYFSTQDTTYAWIKGQIIPIFPTGNCLAWAKDTLFICLTSQPNSQIIRIPKVSQHTEGLIKKLAAPTQ